MTGDEIMLLAEALHREYRAAFKAMHRGRNRPGHIGAPKNCIHEHDHGWCKCHKRGYFIRRAKRLLNERILSK